MLKEVVPTIYNCLQLCIAANEKYASFLKKPLSNDLEIIDWRVNYHSLNEFAFPEEFMIKEDILLFKSNYDNSSNLFYGLMEFNEKANLTERVNIALSISPEENILINFLIAVSPNDIATINLDLINRSLNDSWYQSFYIDSPKFKIDTNALSTIAISVYLGKRGEVFFNNDVNALIIGQLIINCEYQYQFINDLKNPSVRVILERVK